MLMEEISGACGYVIREHFHLVFKQETGTTPSEYRLKFRLYKQTVCPENFRN
ncbi:MAG: AraC family transcriptional regulator [Pontiellaceae bacterium]|nr:AraC family transcriptional regulator [Pontiellaceae bacterium]